MAASVVTFETAGSIVNSFSKPLLVPIAVLRDDPEVVRFSGGQPGGWEAQGVGRADGRAAGGDEAAVRAQASFADFAFAPFELVFGRFAVAFERPFSVAVVRVTAVAGFRQEAEHVMGGDHFVDAEVRRRPAWRFRL